MGNGWREDLPDPVEVPLEEVSAAISELDRLLHTAEVDGHLEIAETLDAVVGRMTRWVWPLLNELDEDYDG
jgi:hypothetical protein